MKNTSVSLPDDIHEWLHAKAAAEERSASKVVVLALREAMARDGKRPAQATTKRTARRA